MIYKILDAALEKCGTATNLAEEIGSSSSEISKFRAGDAGFKIHHLKKLLQISGLTLMRQTEKDSIIDAALTFAQLYKDKSKEKQ